MVVVPFCEYLLPQFMIVFTYNYHVITSLVIFFLISRVPSNFRCTWDFVNRSVAVSRIFTFRRIACFTKYAIVVIMHQ